MLLFAEDCKHFFGPVRASGQWSVNCC